MKKTALLLVPVLLTFLQFANAQDFKSAFENASFGIKGGINLADMIPNPSHPVDKRTAGHFGVFSNVSVTEKISFQPELLISMQGGKQHTTIEGMDYKFTSNEKITYLTLPLMGQYKATEKLYLEAGPQLGFRLASSYISQTIEDGEVILEYEEDTKEHREFFELGISLGVKYSITNRLFAGLRYNYGITPLNVYKEAVKLRNSVIQPSIGFSLYDLTD